jgi:photosystem II stability/assembly factor-like uncharacterized protein
MQKVPANNLKQKLIFSLGIFFAFLIFAFPQASKAEALLAGPISTCGELVESGTYTLTQNVTAVGTSTCFTVAADNVTLSSGTGTSYIITGTGETAIDARARVGRPDSALTEGANAYTNFVIYNVNISGFTTGINASGNNNTSGYGGTAGDVEVRYSQVGSVLANGGNSTVAGVQGIGGFGGSIYILDINIDISNTTLSASGGTGVTAVGDNGGLDLDYTGTLTKTNVVLSAFKFFNDINNGVTTAYGVYAGGTWPMLAGPVSTCGTLYATTTAVFTLTQSITNISGSCFTISGNDITIDGGGFTLSATSSNTSFAVNAGSYSNFTLASTTVTDFSNLITSSSSVTISGTNLDLSNKYISAGSLTLTYTGTLNRVNTTISALTGLVVNGTSYGAQIAGILLDWIKQISSGQHYWWSITSSADGTKLAAVNYQNGYIYTSTDSGATWSTNSNSSGSKYWTSITSSTDGTKLAAVADYIYTSSNSGVTWTTNGNSSGQHNWRSITSSADGTKLAAVDNNGYIYTSSNSGVTWTTNGNSSGQHNWRSITSSADGTKLAAVNYGGYIYTSTTSGVTWATSTSSGIKNWYAIISSADGTRLAAIVPSGYIYTSIDSGTIWATSTSSGIKNWHSITSSADGTKLAAVDYDNGYIYTHEDASPTLEVNIATPQAGATLSWPAIISWGTATRCYYSYDNWVTTATSTCSNNGSDISKPAYGVAQTLKVKGFDANDNVSEKSVSFTLSLPITINSPSVGVSYTSGTWNPSVTWDVFSAGNISTCQYSYNNFTSTSTAGCSLNGADILPPTSSGANTLRLRAVDSNANVGTNSVAFTYGTATSSISIIRPASGSSVTVSGWSPLVNWATSSVACYYSYNNWVSTSTVTSCANNGTDILRPAVEGATSLYVRGVNALSQISSAVVSFTYAPWVQRESSRNWYSIASSIDGKKLAAVHYGGYIYTSTDSGVTWTTNSNLSGARNWYSIASSADGSKLAAVDNGYGYIYTSTDSGVTWTTNNNSSGQHYWRSITSSADGTKLAAGDYNGYIYTSSNSGATWTTNNNSSGQHYWYSITSSADGTKLAAGDWNSGYIYTSSNSGATWTTNNNSSGQHYWYSITSSADGTKLAAVDGNNGYIYTSSNSGSTWTTNNNSSGQHYWYSITSSADGTKLAAVDYNNGYIYTSSNSGVTWTTNNNSSGQRYWQSITSSADGSKLAAGSNGYIYTKELIPQLKVDILKPLTNANIASWNPIVSWGSATSCYYSYNNWTSTSTATCASNGSDISAPASYGTSTLYLKAIDATSTLVTASSTFYKNIPLTITAPVATTSIGVWAPSIVWNADNLSGLSCYYSYDNFATSYSASCSGTGADIVTPPEGAGTLYVKVDDGLLGHINTASIAFNLSYWVQRDSSRSWRSITSSADGTKLAAVDGNNGYIYTSTTSGATWTTNSNSSGLRQWRSITSSADGTKLAAVDGNNGYIYTSTTSGAVWTTNGNSSGQHNWISITSSADGNNLAAVDNNNGYIYTSSNSGVTWTTNSNSSGQHSWMSITSSVDGTKLAAVDYNNGYIYTSSNNGVTWTAQTNSGQRQWRSITSSADGIKLAAVDSNYGYIYTSSNSGVTWTTNSNSSGQRQWQSITSSVDGTKLAAGVTGSGYIYTSSNGGVTWTLKASDTSRSWIAITSSADGTKLAAVAVNGYIYTYSAQSTSGPKVNILLPTNNAPITASWNPIISWGTSATCQYSWDDSNWSNATCSSSGADILPLAYGTSTLYVKGTDSNNIIATSSSTFSRRLPLTITAPGAGTIRSWSPSIIWNSDNVSNLSCFYSYDNFTTSFSASCAGTGADIVTPPEGSNTLYVKVQDLGGNIATASVAFDLSYWVESAGTSGHQWRSVTSSVDGTKLAAVDWNSGYIYTSTTSGLTWTSQTNSGQRAWWSITSSADGTKLAAVVNNGYIYTSNNSGVTWATSTSLGAKNWYSITSSADGTKLAAVVAGGYIYVSTDSGASWAEYGTIASWVSITSSADGTKLAAVDSNGYIYTSSNSGVTWTTNGNSSGIKNWRSITSSADGTKLAAAVTGGYIWTSPDGGVTWTTNSNSSGNKNWESITSSADGTKLAAVVGGGYIYVSTSSGVTWSQRDSSKSWYSIASSADGNKLVAVDINSGSIWTYSEASPSLKINILAPLNNSATNGWNPIVSWGTAVTCQYSYNNSTWNTVACSSNGSNIPAPLIYGTSTLYVRGTDANNVPVSAQSTFNRKLPLTIVSPTPGIDRSWAPNIIWNADNVAGIECYYSYNNFSSTYFASCSGNGAEIAAPTEGNHTLYVKVVDGGNSYTASASFNLTYWQEGEDTRGHYWQSITSSADGTKLAAVDGNNGYIYTSSNSGVTWTTNNNSSGQHYWGSITSSADGTKLAVVDYINGYIYTSTTSGVTWTTNGNSSGQHEWRSITSSADGTKLAAVDGNNGYIYTSSNSGVTWTTNNNSSGSRYWKSITSSADGTKLAAVDSSNGYIYTSADSGVTWTTNSDSSGAYGWTSITSSADGTKLAAGVNGGDIYTSTDGGQIWNPSNAPSGYWYSITSSADGTKLAAVVNGGYIYTSTDGGETWSQKDTSKDWQSITSSADGNKLFAVDYTDGSIWTYASANPELKVDVLTPTNYSNANGWHPIVSWGTAIDCGYNWDGSGSYNTVVCSNNGSDIPTPASYGTSTLYIKGIDASSTEAFNQSTFNKSLPLTINSPAGGLLSTWAPNITWNADNQAGLTCSYSYDNFSNSTNADCSGTGSEIISPTTDGNNTLYVKAEDGSGNISIQSISFSSGWIENTNYSPTWNSVASSLDGTKLAAVSTGYIYTSTTSGASWIEQTSSGSRSWKSITSSTDGTKLAAVVNGGYVYTSTTSGETWNEVLNNQNRNWTSISSSADGMKLIAAETSNNHIWTSTDGGDTWIENTTYSGSWNAVRISADGAKLFAAQNSGPIYYSNDGGTNWSQGNNSSGSWYAITSSTDGTKLAAAQYNGYIYYSTDSGQNWSQGNSGYGSWNSITSSADGMRLAATQNGGYIYYSTDGGQNWTQDSENNYKYWQAIASSGDGSKLVAGETTNNHLWTYSSIHASLKVDIILPVNSGTLNSIWSPLVSWGNSITCEYSWDGDYNYTTLSSCSNNGADIPAPSGYGPKTLYVRGTDSSNNSVVASSAFNRNLAITISSPTSGFIKNWAPVVNWDPDNLGIDNSSCYYSYNGYQNDYPVTCSNNGSDILPPSSDGSKTLYLSYYNWSLGAYGYASVSFSSGWVQNDDYNYSNLYDITSSADGTKLAMVQYSGYIYYSTDSGLTWNTGNYSWGNWYAITSSADGTKLAATQSSGSIYYSTDSGQNWYQGNNSYGSWNYNSITSSADGMKLVAVEDGGVILYSTDGGQNWDQSNAPDGYYWDSVTSSADGMKVYASDTYNGYVWKSTDGGQTWAIVSNSSYSFTDITSSADGGKLFGVQSSGSYVYYSTDGGVNWNSSSNGLSSGSWRSITSSADGMIVTAGQGNNGYIYTSTDGGQNWNQKYDVSGSSFSGYWYGLDSSADGTKVAAVNYNNNYIWNYSSLLSKSDFKVDILVPANGSVSTTWSPIISWGISTACEYSWDNSTYASSTCSNNGSDISAPDGYGSKTLYIRGTDVNNNQAVSSSTFTSSLPLTINSPTSGALKAWAPSVVWNANNLGSVTCYYSYTGFYPNYNQDGSVDCSAGGAGINPPNSDGSYTLYLTVYDNNTGNYGYASVSFQTGWVAYYTDSNYSWASITSSADGTKLAAADNNNGYIYTSTDSGATWTTNNYSSGQHYWASITSSADGTKLAAGQNNSGTIYYSTDGGQIWNPSNAPNGGWYSITSSADGTKLAAADNNNGYIYTSTDSGATWTTNNYSSGSRNWYSITSSADGTKLAAVEKSNYHIWTSTDSGATWLENTNYYASWNSITSSADGIKLAAAVDGGYIYYSTDGGLTWNQDQNSNSYYWMSITSSADGNNLAAVNSSGYVYKSTNGGQNWSPDYSSGQYSWRDIASSADGSKIIALETSNYDIWTYADITPDLKVDIMVPSNNSVVANWNPYISFGSAVTCEYSLDEQNTWTTTTCAGNGADIPEPAFGTTTVYVRGTDFSNNNVTSSVTINYIHYTWCGTVDSDWNTIGNWYTEAACTNQAPGLPDGSVGTSVVGTTSPIVYLNNWVKPLSIDSTGLTGSAHDSGVIFTLSGSVTNVPISGNATFDSGAYNYSNINGDVTFTNASYNSGNINGDVVFNDGSYNNSSITGNVIFDNNSINTGSIVGGVIFNNASGNGGSIEGITTFNDSSFNGGGSITGTTTLNGTSYNASTIIGDAIFNTTYYGSLATTSVMNISGSAYLQGSVSGIMYASDGVTPITSFNFSGSSRNLSTITGAVTFTGTTLNVGTINGDVVFSGASTNSNRINGNATFYSTSTFSMGEVNGTSTLAGTNQTVNGGNVTNLVKQASSRETLYLVSGSTINVSGITTLLGTSSEALLTVRATNPTSYAILNINGTSNMDFLRMQRIRNNAGTVDLSSKTVYDDGNNLGFTFPSNSSASTRGGSTRPPTTYVLPSSRIVTPPPSDNNNSNTSNSDTNSGSNSGRRFVPGSINQILLPLQNLKPINLVKLPTFGTDTKGAFSFLTPLKNFLFAPLPANITASPRLLKFLESIGLSSQQNILNLRGKSITLNEKANGVPGIFSAYAKGLPTRIDGSFNTNTSLPITTNLKAGTKEPLTQTLKVPAGTNFTISLTPTTNTTAKGTFLGKEILFTKNGDKLTINLTAPRKAGSYILTTSASPLPLVIEVTGTTNSTPNITNETSTPSLWSRVKSFFSW